MSIDEMLLLLVTIVLVALILFASGALVSRDWSFSGTYALRLVFVSLIAVVLIPIFRNAAANLNLDELGLLFAFVLLIVVVRFILVDELTVSDEWLAAIVISLLGVVLIYAVDEVAHDLFDIRVLSLF
jgi:peptidoglycan/LPS O-acetylase OafA/YrhL